MIKQQQYQNTSSKKRISQLRDDFKKGWYRCNIFNYNKMDAGAYVVFYLIIPILITSISIQTTFSDITALAYCYTSILISAFNGIYDAANRWKPSVKTVHNTKVFLIILVDSFICIYCLYIIFYALMINKLPMRYDVLLLIYLITMLIGISDFGGCFADELALKDYFSEGDDLR